MNNMQTRRRPAQTRRKPALRGSRVAYSDPTHPRVVSVGTDPTHVRADPSHGQVTARRDAGNVSQKLDVVRRVPA